MEKDYSTVTRDSKREAFMKAVVLGWQESGITKTAYCIKNNITQSEYGYWRRKLNISDSRHVRSYETDFLSLSESIEKSKGHVCTSEMDFLSLSVSEPIEKKSSKLLSIKLPNGVKITFY